MGSQWSLPCVILIKIAMRLRKIREIEAIAVPSPAPVAHGQLRYLAISGPPRKLPGLGRHLDRLTFFNKERDPNLDPSFQLRGLGHTAA